MPRKHEHTRESIISGFYYDECTCGATRQLNTRHPMPWKKVKLTMPMGERFNFMPKGEVV